MRRLATILLLAGLLIGGCAAPPAVQVAQATKAAAFINYRYAIRLD